MVRYRSLGFFVPDFPDQVGGFVAFVDRFRGVNALFDARRSRHVDSFHRPFERFRRDIFEP